MLKSSPRRSRCRPTQLKNGGIVFVHIKRPTPSWSHCEIYCRASLRRCYSKMPERSPRLPTTLRSMAKEYCGTPPAVSRAGPGATLSGWWLAQQ